MSSSPEPPNRTRSWQEELMATGEGLVERVEGLVREGNVRRVIIKHEGRTLLEIPLSVGIVGALLAPQVAALGALAALVTDCSVAVVREEPVDPADGDAPALPPAAGGPTPGSEPIGNLPGRPAGDVPTTPEAADEGGDAPTESRRPGP
jgi:Domain of unknown function (DUF4342)